MSFTDRLGLSVSQAVFAWGLVVLIGGVAGLFSTLICFYALSSGGVDPANKHGISQVSATRVGGLAIVSYMLLHLGYQGQLVIDLPVAVKNVIMLTCFAFAVLGVFADLQGDFPARRRFVALVGGLAIVSYMLLHLGYQGQLVIDLPVAEENVIMLSCLAFLVLGIFKDQRGSLSAHTRFTARAGGVAIVAYMLMHLGYQGQLVIDLPVAEENAIMLTCLAFFALGIFEDQRGTLSARTRFVAMLLVASVSLALSPSSVLQPVGIVWVDVILQASALVALLFTAVCIAFIPNAFNTADGANGLIAGTSVFALAGLATVAGPALGPFLLAALVGCLVFLVFNLVSGRFFLGDGGAYFLGALCGLGLIQASNSVDVSVWWLLALVFYPIADLIWSIGRRLLSGRSPFEPDNQHLHNLLFAWFDSGSMSSAAANSLTGVSIAVLFSGLPVFLVWSGAWAVTDSVWLLWVVAQWCVYGLTWKYLSDRLCALPDELSQT